MKGNIPKLSKIPMPRTSTFHVINNRLRFKCPTCGNRRNMALLPTMRRKKVICHKCGLATNCLLNRRISQRASQVGKIVMITSDGRETEVMLHDISREGAGIELPPGSHRSLKISTGSKVRLKCTWNPRLLSSNYYEVKGFVGQRIGVKRL